MEMPLVIVALIVIGGLSLIGCVAAFRAIRSRSFRNRVDRRTAEQHEFEESWSKILAEAERVAQAHKQKSLQHNARDLRH